MFQEVYGVYISNRKTFISECEKVEVEMFKGPMWRDWRDFDLYKHQSGLWVIYYCESFPCFDSYDRANEDRCYRSFLFCKTEEEALRKLDFIKESRIGLRYLGVNKDCEELKPYINCNDR